MSETSGLYYSGRYWNDLPAVRRHLDRRASGRPDTTWIEYLATDGRRFPRALILNCGNGWVERDLFRAGLVDEVVGIDIDPSLIATARSEADAVGLTATYIEMDVNRRPLPDGPFDLVLNHAAGHHVTHINRVFSDVAERLSSEGQFVSWDYVGPHRNQYPEAIWDAASAMNERLPAELRQQMSYPNIDTMIATDPSEAVHSELVVPTIERHFDVVHFARLGGAIGYLLLSHNDAMHESATPDRDRWVDAILDADARFVGEHPELTLFAFIIATRRSTPHPAEVLERWRREEHDREQDAVRNGGEYGPRTAVSDLMHGPRVEPSPLGRWVSHHFPGPTGAYNRVIERVRSVRERRQTSRPR